MPQTSPAVSDSIVDQSAEIKEADDQNSSEIGSRSRSNSNVSDTGSDILPLDSSGTEYLKMLKSPFLTNSKPTSRNTHRFSQIKSGLKTAWDYVGKPLKGTGKATIALVAAGTTSINALMNRSGLQPKDIGSKWWNNLDNTDKALSVTEGASSLIVNFFFTFFFIEETWKFLSIDLPHSVRTGNHLKKNLAILFFGLAAAVAQGAIAYNAVLWIPITEFIGIITAINILNTLVSRTSGAKRALNFLKGRVDEDVVARNLVISDLKRVNDIVITNIESNSSSTYKETINRIILEGMNKYQEEKLSKDELIEKSLLEIFSNLNTLIEQHPNLIVPKTTAHKVGSELVGFLDYASGTLVGLMAFITFTQKGYDGIKALSGSSISDNGWDQAFIGFLPSIANAMLYFISTYAYRKETIGHLSDAIEHRDWGKLATILMFAVVNYFASGSTENIAMGVSQNEKGIFHGLLQGNMVRAHAICNRIGSFTPNSLSCYKILNKFSLFQHQPTPVKDLIAKVSDLDLSITELKPRALLESMKLFHNKADKHAAEEAQFQRANRDNARARTLLHTVG